MDRLTVSKGIVSVIGDANRSVKYGELTGDKPFNLPVTGSAPVKQAGQYKIAGTSVPRNDIPDKVSGKHVYMQRACTRHATRPRGAYAVRRVSPARGVDIDEGSIRNIPARVLRKGDFIGVVAEKEWDAVRAAEQLKVTWDIKPVLPGNDRMYEHMRSANTQDRVVLERGNITSALAAAPHVVSQIGRGPYHAHAAFSPECAVADVKRTPR